jgi:hypothetical protein
MSADGSRSSSSWRLAARDLSIFALTTPFPFAMTVSSLLIATGLVFNDTGVDPGKITGQFPSVFAQLYLAGVIPGLMAGIAYIALRRYSPIIRIAGCATTAIASVVACAALIDWWHIHSAWGPQVSAMSVVYPVAAFIAGGAGTAAALSMSIDARRSGRA